MLNSASQQEKVRPLPPIAQDSAPRSTLGLLWRLMGARGRNRADLCYAFMGTRNCPSTDCMYLNLGYWPGAAGYCQAAEALVDLLGNAAGIRPGDIVVDAGCGFGDQDARLAARHDPARIHALNVTALQIEHARTRLPDPRIDWRVASATQLPFADGSVDRVISLEAAFHFDTREDFLREAFRVLRPGGRLAVIDLVALERDGQVVTGGLRGRIERWSAQVPEANVYGTTRLGEILRRLGYRDVAIRSIAEQVVPGYLEYMRKVLNDPVEGPRFHPLIRETMRRAGNPFASNDYILATADKPAA
jgi:erythromycin 3''-O-methyltransferase